MKWLALPAMLALAVCASASTAGSALISVAGDILLDRGVAVRMEAEGPEYPYEMVRGIFSDDDITLANLECPLTDVFDPSLKRRDLVFRAAPQNARFLKEAGFDILNLANNHSMDHKGAGLLQTISLLDEQGITPVGAGGDHEEAISARYEYVSGLKIGFIGCSVFPPEGFVCTGADCDVARIDPERIESEISRAKAGCDFLVVTVHWGNEYENYPSDRQRELAHLMLDAGADIIAGHHPHVIQGVEKYNGKYVFYSLGNFVFDRQIQKGTDTCIILQIRACRHKAADVSIIPVNIDSCQPRPAQGDEAHRIFEALSAYSQGLIPEEEIGKWEEDYAIGQSP